MAGEMRRGRARDLPLPRLVAQALRERVNQRYFMIEQYGPDGEIVKASEGHPIAPGEEGVHTLVITGTDYAEPRTDWRERGIVPPKGFHRRAEIEQRRNG